jgi:Zinc carboxypeptidase
MMKKNGTCHCRILIALVVLSIWSVVGSISNAIESSELLSLLPAGCKLNQQISSPEQHLGWQVGTRHVRHHEVVSYARLLCEQSDRMTWQSYGQTFGQRPLGVVLVSRLDRQSQLDSIAEHRQAWAYGNQDEALPRVSDSKNVKSPPSVLWLGYSIHGDESGAVNASLLMMYLLAAAEGPWIDAILEQHLIVIDPSLNPDGMDRFAQWVNDHRGLHAAADPQDIEHQQGWPRGRSNHYGFDLNRDWLPATQPESQGRLELFYRWLPNVVLDFHEMGTEQSLFFQPGIEGRDHPMSPAFVRDITQGLARRYAATMDFAGQRYFTREKYDDFYPGKGSTYPDLHGAVGILVEQGSTRGLIHEYSGSTRRFEETILNPLRLSIASMAGIQEYHRPLLEYQRDFYSTQRKARLESQPSGFAIAIPEDRRIASEFLMLLTRHRIDVYSLPTPWNVDERKLEANQWWIIPSDQKQGLFVQAIIDRRKEFPFDKFYDVSAWNMADAFGLEWMPLSSTIPQELLRETVSVEALKSVSASKIDSNAVAVAIPGNPVHSATLIQRLSTQGIQLRMSNVDCLVTAMNDKQVQLGTGSIVVHRADQPDKWPHAIEKCQLEVDEWKLDAISIKSSLTESGPDLGSDSFPVIEIPKVAMLVGTNTDVSGAGGLWFALDRLLRIPCSRIEPAQLTASQLARYTCLFIPDGDSQRLSDGALEAVRQWVREGGHLVLIGGAVSSLSSILSESEESERPKALLSQVSGIILEVRPSSGSYWSRVLGKNALTVFQNDAIWPIKQPSVLRLTNQPLLAGYLSEQDQRRIANQTALGQTRVGRGGVTSMTFDPTFRGHYWSTIRILKHILFRPVE